MTIMRLREPFSRDRSFIVVKPMKLNGSSLPISSPFDKTAVNTRKLRQLYDQRYITMTADAPQLKVVAPADPEKMSNNQLTLLLEDNGIIIRPNPTRVWLINRAKRYLADKAQTKQ
jgi:hypothetical protein